jgi:hypothetical protein
MQAFQKFDTREHAALFIAMNSRKHANAKIASLFPGAREKEPGKAMGDSK